MSSIIRKSTGEIIGAYPTQDPEESARLRRIAAAEAAAGDKHAAEQAKIREAELAAQPDCDERKTAAIAGLRRMAKKAAREGKAAKGKKLAAFADQADEALKKYEALTKAISAKRPDPLGKAQSAGAVELQKVLPACFPSEADGLAFARRHLPLLGAVKAATTQADTFAHKARERTQADRDFTAAVVAGGRLALASIYDDANLKALVAAGL